MNREENYSPPKVSGSAFFMYALAWDVNHHLLDREKYEPIIAKA